MISYHRCPVLLYEVFDKWTGGIGGFVENCCVGQWSEKTRIHHEKKWNVVVKSQLARKRLLIFIHITYYTYVASFRPFPMNDLRPTMTYIFIRYHTPINSYVLNLIARCSVPKEIQQQCTYTNTSIILVSTSTCVPGILIILHHYILILLYTKMTPLHLDYKNHTQNTKYLMNMLLS